MGGKIVLFIVLASCAIGALCALLHPLVMLALRSTDATVRSRAASR